MHVFITMSFVYLATNVPQVKKYRRFMKVTVIKNYLCLINIGKIAQEQSCSHSSTLAESSFSSAPLITSISSLIVLKTVIDRGINVDSNPTETFISNCINNLLIFELKGSFALTMNRFVFEHNKDSCVFVKVSYAGMFNKKECFEQIETLISNTCRL